MSQKKRRLTFADEELLELTIEDFITGINFDWNCKWEKYGYTNREKTFLILKNLDRALELREEIREPIFLELGSFNSEKDVLSDLKKIADVFSNEKKMSL